MLNCCKWSKLMTIKEGLLKNLAKFTGKHLCWGLFCNKVAGLRLWVLLNNDFRMTSLGPCRTSGDKAFKNRPSNICGRQPLKNVKWYGLSKQTTLNRPYHFKFFKGCLPQILLGLFLNTLSHVWLVFLVKWINS